MRESQTISFVATRQLKQLLESWAQDEDRTVSAVLRRILLQEARRRKQYSNRQAHLVNHINQQLPQDIEPT